MRSTYLPAFEELVANRKYDSSQANALPGGDGDGQPDFPGGRRYFRLTYLAKKFWDWVRFRFRVLVKLCKRFQNLHFFTESGKNDRLGRPTTPDNFLLGARNSWARLLEESWPEIGWLLLCIRNRRSSTIGDVREAMVSLREKPNGGLAAAFYRDTIEVANAMEIRKNRVRISEELDPEILETQTKRDTEKRLYQEAEAALREVHPGNKGAVQAAAIRRTERLLQLEDTLKKIETERDVLDKKLLAQEAYFYQSELLDFLLSIGRYAINPRNLANVLAGLPTMRWRQSYSRCSKMPYDSEPHLWYGVLETLTQMWECRSEEFNEAPVEFFRAGLLSMPNKRGYGRQFLCENWRDVRLAIEECWKLNLSGLAVPFTITSLFVRNVSRQKTAVESVLAAQERLT
jgi:hypothetical protein